LTFGGGYPLTRTSLRKGDPAQIGHYRLTARLGSGGMGVVYLGVAPGGGLVAVKVLRPELADDPDFRKRFGREVAVLMRVEGVCTVRVIEADTDSLLPFMVTEYADGPSLAEYIDKYGALSAEMLYGLATGLAEALTVIHAAGIVHRDLKPSNVILTPDGPKVIDFGIAQTLDATSVTRTGMMVGSAGFMAPEQVTGRPGPAADIFVWGVTVGYAAIGHSPFGTGDTNAVLYRVLYADPDIAAVPEPLKPLVEAALAKDPQSRPAARELLDRLTAISMRPEPMAGRPYDTPTQTVLSQTWQETAPHVARPPAGRPPTDVGAGQELAAAGQAPVGPGQPKASDWWLASPPSLQASRNQATRPPAAQRPVTQRPATQRPAAQPPATGSLLLDPAPTDTEPARKRVSRRTVAIGAPAIAVVVAGAAVLVAFVLPHHSPKVGSHLSGDGTSAIAATTALPGYPGQQQRGVFQGIDRIVAAGNTMVTTGAQTSASSQVTASSQTSPALVRQQFFVSTDAGAAGSWHVAPVHTPGGGQAPLGYPAVRIAGGTHGWMAEGPDAIWTSPNGLSWTLAATHGITPQEPGDSIDVVTNTADGFLAAGQQTSGGPQAVIWTSRDGLTWQRVTASQLHLVASGATPQSITFAASRGDDTVISDGGTVWLSTDDGSAWTPVTVPVDHGAQDSISGVSFDGSGLIAVRPGLTTSQAPDGVAYFSPNGLTWQYTGTIDAAGGWSPQSVKGSNYGFVVTGIASAGKIVAYTSTGTGTTWRPTGVLGNTSGELVPTATVGPGSSVVAVGSANGSKTEQQAVFVEADTAGNITPVSLTAIAGGVIPAVTVNSTAVADGEQIAVGSADGYPAVWRKASTGSWVLVTSLSQVSGTPGLTALTSVTYGSAGWLAVGTPGPVILTSANGTTWQAAGSIAHDLAGVASAAAAAGRAGYVIVGRKVEPSGACSTDVWWSQNLTSWTQAHDVNDTSGSSQVLAVAAGSHGFVSVGSHDDEPVVWTTADGRSWTTRSLPFPSTASAAVMYQVAIDGNRVVATGQQTTSAGLSPLVELSTDGGNTWRQVPFSSPGPDTAITALTTGAGGFTAAGQSGAPGSDLSAVVWTSADGASWTQSSVSGLTGGGSHDITTLARSGSAVTGIDSIQAQAAQKFVTVPLPAL
jgi:serine/threonine protein kinase